MDNERKDIFMNWGKAKRKLIILFIIVNILLFWGNYRKEIGVYTLRESQLNDIRQVLKEHNIYIDVDIPKNYQPIQALKVFPYQLDSSIREKIATQILGGSDGLTVSIQSPKSANEQQKRIYRRADQVVTFDGESILYRDEGILNLKGSIDIKEAKKIADQWIKQMEYDVKNMYIQIIQQADDMYIIYYEQHEGVPVFDSYVKMHITPSGISEAKIRKVEVGELTGPKQNIYSADQVFFNLIKTISQNHPIHIKDIVIGYALENPRGTHLIAEDAIPFYQVILESGEIYYINAYNNDLRDENPPIMEDLQ